MFTVFLEPDKEREVRVDPALMKLLASDTRRKVLRKLGKRAMTLSELSRALDLKKATILEHLRRLEDAELIRRREDDRLWIYYDLTPRARSLVDPVGTRVMIVLGVSVFALAVGAMIGILAQPHMGFLPGDDGAGAFSVTLDESDVSSADGFALAAGWTGDAGNAEGARTYLLGAEQAQRLRAGQSWVPAAQLDTEPAPDGGLLISGPPDIEPGTYQVLVVDAVGDDNRDDMPMLHVRPMQVELSHTVWWHGLDDDLQVTLPEIPDGGGTDTQGWILVTPAGDAAPLVLPVANQSATIPYAHLDDSGPGTHKLHYKDPDTERIIELPSDFSVQRADIQVLPPLLLEGSDKPIQMLFSAPGSSRPTHVPVQVDGQELESDLAQPSRGVVTVPQATPGTMQVQVGRHHAQELTVLPDLRLQATLHEGPELEFRVTGAQGETRSGIELQLGDQTLGTTGADGTLSLTPPLSQGPALMRLVTPDNHSTAMGVEIDGWEIHSHDQVVALENFIQDDLSVDVRNLEAWPVAATIVTTLDDEVIAAAPVELESNEDRRIALSLAEANATGARYAVHAEGAPVSDVVFSNQTLQASPPAGGGGAAPPGEPQEPEPEDPTALFGTRIADSLEAFVRDTEDEPPDGGFAPGDEEEPTPGLATVVPIVAVVGIILLVRLAGRRGNRQGR